MYPENEVAFVYEDSEFDDFDAQANQLASYDQTYIKTSTGRFRGRRTSAYLVVLTRPGSELELNIPAEGGTFLVLSVERLTLEPLVITAAGREHFAPERRGASVIRNACVARILEVGCKALLQACSRPADGGLPQGIASTFVAGLAAALDFQASLDAHARGARVVDSAASLCHDFRS